MATRDADRLRHAAAAIARGRFLPAVLFLILALAGVTSGNRRSTAAASAEDEPPLPEVTETRLIPAPPPSDVLRTFSPGEELTYAIKFGPIRAGTAVLSVVGYEWANGGLCYRLRSTVRSTGIFSKIFHVDDLTESWLDADSLFSRRYVRILHEGKYRKNEAVQIDARQGLAFYSPRGDTAAVTPGSQDVLSVLYYARGLPLDVGLGMMIPGHVDRKNVPFELRVLKRETVKVPAGRFSCGVVEPLLRSAGLFKQEGRVTLWVSDDANRYPVIVRSRVKVGSISAVLESVRPGNGQTRQQFLDQPIVPVPQSGGSR